MNTDTEYSVELFNGHLTVTNPTTGGVPSNEDGELALGTFKVVGAFAIEEKINNAQKAREAFESSELALLR